MSTADARDQLTLLDLQRVDTSLDRIEHRLRTLPARTELSAAQATLAELRDRIVAAEAEVGDLERAVRKAEAEVDAVRTRAERDEQLLISGTITSPKQLEELQHEVASLARRRSDLEDVELEVMEQLESAVTYRDVLGGEHAEAEQARATAEKAVADAEMLAAAERSIATTERAALVTAVPADLLSLYERIRADNAGVGAAALSRGRCEGCQMQLPPSDIERFRAAESNVVLRCEECRRILVRTPESGL